MAQAFMDRLAGGPILADGAIGTQLYARGVDFNQCFEAVNLHIPRLVADIHRDYINAGAELVETNTYGANRIRLAPYGLAGKVREINFRAMKLAREAREIAGASTLIAGAVGPLGQALHPFGQLHPDEARGAFAEQIGALLEQGADLLLLETFGDLRELLIAIEAAHAVGDLPIAAQMSFAEDGRTALGNTFEEVVLAMMV